MFEQLIQVTALPVGPRQKNALAVFHKEISRFRKMVDSQPPDDLVEELLQSFQIREHYEQLGDIEGQERLANIQELVASVAEYREHNPESGLREFLEEVSLLTDIDNWNASADAVALMTLHSAKGLEFPVVFITGLEEGLMPLRGGFDDRADLDEERRLFYVGVTRAEKQVILSYAVTRRRYGALPQPMMVSSFVRELPEHLVEHKALQVTAKTSGDQKATFDSIAKSRSGEEAVLQQGDKVEHAMFGIGQIVRMEGSGERARVTIKFSGNVSRKFIAKHAKLKKL